ncbi:MAG: DUF1330 domain-containing protein [Bacteroidia bacterium]|nr:DUF1330 domain-containing protein [Bacteroidia bacterium]
MAVYVLVMMKINDPETYSKYTARTPEIVKRHGGKFLTRGEEVLTFEGTPYDDRLVILEFPDKESVDGWYNDPEYQEAVKFRKASSHMNMLLVQEGGSNTKNPDPKL